MDKAVPFKKPNIFHSRIKILRIIGCWPLIGFVKTKSEMFYCMGTFILISNLVLGSFLTFYSTVLMFIQHGRFNETVCNQTIVFIIAFQIFSKVVIMLRKAPKIRKLIDELNNDLCDEFVVKEEDFAIIKKCFGYDKKLAIFFCVLSLLLTIANTSKPLIVTLAKRWKKMANNDRSPTIGSFPSTYHFEVDAESFWYGFWYAQQCMYVFPAGTVSWISDSIFCSFLYYLSGYAKDLVSAFAPLMVIQLLLGGITIGCLMIQFLLTNEGSSIQYLKPMLYLVLKLIQLYILCWHGQLLLNKSVAVGQAIYFSSWYNQSRDCHSDLKMIMIRSSRPTKFAYAGIFQLSAKRFASILNTSCGYFAMMNSIKQE